MGSSRSYSDNALGENRQRINDLWDTRPTKEKIDEEFAKKQKALAKSRRDALEKAKE